MITLISNFMMCELDHHITQYRYIEILTKIRQHEQQQQQQQK